MGLSLVRTRYAGNFATVLGQDGASVPRALEKVNLDERVLERPDGLIPADQLWQFAENAAHQSGRLDIGWDAGRAAALENYGEFGSSVLARKTLYQRMQAFCSLAKAEYTEADFYVTATGDALVFGRGRIVGTPLQIRQVELYVLAMMVGLVRTSLGADWRPRLLRLQSFSTADIEKHFPGTRINFDSPATELWVFGTELTGVDNGPAGTETPRPFSFTDSIEELIKTYIHRPELGLQLMASITGVNARQLQRRLQEDGTTFSELVHHHRADTAIRMLTGSSQQIGEIGRALGYGDQAHFTRAFKRQTGLTPSHYRRNISK